MFLALLLFSEYREIPELHTELLEKRTRLRREPLERGPGARRQFGSSRGFFRKQCILQVELTPSDLPRNSGSVGSVGVGIEARVTRLPRIFRSSPAALSENKAKAAVRAKASAAKSGSLTGPYYEFGERRNYWQATGVVVRGPVPKVSSSSLIVAKASRVINILYTRPSEPSDQPSSSAASSVPRAPQFHLPLEFISMERAEGVFANAARSGATRYLSFDLHGVLDKDLNISAALLSRLLADACWDQTEQQLETGRSVSSVYF